VGLVSYLGLGVLVERLRQFRAGGGDIKLVRVNLATERLLRMAGISRLFESYENDHRAVQVYQKAA